MTDELDGQVAEFEESDLIPISALEHYAYCPPRPIMPIKSP